MAKKTKEQFVEQIYDLVGDEYSIIGEYVNTATKLKMKHNICNHEWKVTPNSFTSGGCRCPKCSKKESNKNKTKSQNDFVNEVYQLVGNEYLVVGNYVNALTKIKLLHNKCGKYWDVTPNNFLKGNRCLHCKGEKLSKKNAKSHEQFVNEVFELVNEEYSILTKYKNAHTKILIRHNLCGNEWNVEPRSFLDENNRCPHCSSSRGEKIICEYLSKNNIQYKQRVVFEDCKNERPLPFDVGIENKLIIEYDGEGHFEPFRFSKDENKMLKKLKENQRNDCIKNQYCILKSIPLIRVPYWEFKNIEYILENTLKYFHIKRGKCNDLEIVEKYFVNNKWDQNKYLKEYKQWLLTK